MVSISQNAEGVINSSSQTYNTAGIRHLPIEEQVRYRKDKVDTWLRLRADGYTAERAAERVGVPVRTLYEWKKKPIPESTRPHNVRTRADQRRYKKLRNIVLKLRMKKPTWGRVKVHAVMERDGVKVCRSMVGRIISELIEEREVASYFSGKFAKKRNTNRSSRTHATPRPKEGLPSTEPGGVVQIDTTYYKLGSNRFIYQISGICTYSKLTVAHLFDAPNSENATYLLKKLLRRAPFNVQSVQTDQGSEFKGRFEHACMGRELPFYVNHPHTPKQNAFIERFNRTVKDEFLSRDDLPFDDLKAMNRELDKYIKSFNTQRPHQGINNLTPMEFIQQHLEAQRA